MTHTLEELGRSLAAPPEPGAVTDHEQARLFELVAPNTMNAWTHVVPLLARLRKQMGKKTLFGRDKGAKELEAVATSLRLVVLGLYGDGELRPGASDSTCLLELTRSLVSFKKAFPNWTDAYLAAEDLLVAKHEGVLPLLAVHQHSVEAELAERGIG